MNFTFLHFYPDLMNLYGSYANVALLRRHLEQLGHTVTVNAVHPGEKADLAAADFLFMGAGTERRQTAALTDFKRHSTEVKKAATDATPMLFCGTAMDLLGTTIKDARGIVRAGIELADFSTLQTDYRIVGDVYGHTSLYNDALVGFMNKCSKSVGIKTPLLTTVEMGFGNEGPKTPEGYREHNVFASQLTGPILTKNPRLLQEICTTVLQHRGASLPTTWPTHPYEENSYQITATQLKQRAEVSG